jgi:hypothetical protein
MMPSHITTVYPWGDEACPRERQGEMARYIPRHAVSSEFLETIYDNRPDFRRIFPLFVRESCPDIEFLAANISP